MKLAWLTDIHLNFLDSSRRNQFYYTLQEADRVIITGDISDGKNVAKHLTEMYRVINKPIYFVLGNHDFYHTSIGVMRDRVFNQDFMLEQLDGNVIYLTQSPIHIELTPGVFLIGVDGFADARSGDFAASPIALNDQNYIGELKHAAADSRRALGKKMAQLADTDTHTLNQYVVSTLASYTDVKKIIIATHVPPFPETSRYQGKESSSDFQPFFCNLMLGRYLLELAKKCPDIQFDVLCGHAHEKCELEKLPNLKIKVGGASYHHPEIQEIIEL